MVVEGIPIMPYNDRITISGHFCYTVTPLYICYTDFALYTGFSYNTRYTQLYKCYRKKF